MSKALKPIIISGVVIVLIVIALLLMIFVFPAAGEPEEAEATATAAPADTIKIIDESDTDLVSFEMLPADGESMLVEISRDDKGALSYTVTPATQYFDYDTSKFRSMMYTLTSMSATNLVEENAQDLSIYGLEDPWFTVRCTFTGNRVLELYLGNATPTDSNYYCKTNESNTVYTLGSYVVSLLTRADIDYRQITLFPTYTEDDIYTNINYVKMTLRNGTEIEIQKEDLDNLSEYNVTGSAYYMLSPVESSCNDTLVQSEVLDVVATLTSSEVLFDITEDEYAEYGFDNPAKLEMTDVEGNSVSILIGAKYTDGYYYVMLEQSPETVIACPESAFTWLDINYITLMNRVVWYEQIVDIASIEYDMNGTEYVLDMEHYTETDEEGNESAAINATLNGEAISETNARRLFVRTLNFRIIGNVPVEAELGEPEYTITMIRTDGSTRTMELISLNARQYAVRLDGEVQFYVYLRNITTLEEAFVLVQEGRELPMSYDN